jgi:5,10-methenyltetrahydrofolate synthetase
MISPDNIVDKKTQLRWAMLDKRDALDVTTRIQLSRIITKKLLVLPEYKKAKIILAYKSIGSEFDTTEFIQDVLTNGKILVLPKVNKANKTLDIFRVENPATDLINGVWGIAEPDPAKCKSISINEVDFVLLPGLAFDTSGQRIGYGGGYYDKLLVGKNKNTHLIAAAYSMQIVKAIPALPHDMKADLVITEISI